MSSGSRSEPLESLLAAKYELEFSDDAEKAEYAAEFERQIAALLATHPTVSRGDLNEAIAFKYIEYKRARRKSQRNKETL